METKDRAIKARRIGAYVACFGLLVSVQPASAARQVATLHSGNICQATSGADASLIRHDIIGTSNYGAYKNTSVTCPMVRQTQKGNGATVFVDVEHEGVQTTTCTLYSVNCSGLVNGQSGPVGPRLLGSTVGSWTGEGAGFVGLNLEGAGKSNGCSDYSVVCELTSINADPTGIDRVPGGVTITAVHLYERK